MSLVNKHGFLHSSFCCNLFLVLGQEFAQTPSRFRQVDRVLRTWSATADLVHCAIHHRLECVLSFSVDRSLQFRLLTCVVASLFLFGFK